MNDKVPLVEVIEKPTEQPLVDDNKISKVGFMDDIEYHRVADSLDIDYSQRTDATIAQKLSFLYDWAKETSKSDDRITRIEAIRGLQKTLGFTEKGVPAIKKLYEYARLDQDRRRIEREMSLIG